MDDTPSSHPTEPAIVGVRFSPRLVVGVCVLLVGVLLTLDNLGILEADVFLDYWPLVFVCLGAGKLLSAERTGSRLGAMLWIALGLWWIAYNVGLTDIAVFELFWPVMLMIGGWFLIRRAIAPKPSAASLTTPGAGSAKGSGLESSTGFALWTGVKRRIHSQDFTGGDFTAIMGGCDVDLTYARIQSGPAVIDVFAFWGGIEIKVPPSMRVQPEVTAILGGVSDRTDPTQSDPDQRLIVRGLAMMGGVDIRTVPGPVPPPPQAA